MTRRKILPACAVAAALLAGSAASARAAEGDEPQRTRPTVNREAGRPGSFMISVGGEWLAAETIGSRSANIVSNNPSGSPYTIFSTTTTRAAAPAFRVGIGYAVTRMITVEGGMLISRGDLRSDISQDVENASTTAISESFTQYFFDASVLAHLTQLAFSDGAGIPYLEAGAGYLRQLHEGNTAIDTGQIYHFGGGVRYLFGRARGRSTGLGFRANARVYVRNKGYTLDKSQSISAAVGGALLFMF